MCLVGKVLSAIMLGALHKTPMFLYCIFRVVQNDGEGNVLRCPWAYFALREFYDSSHRMEELLT